MKHLNPMSIVLFFIDGRVGPLLFLAAFATWAISQVLASGSLPYLGNLGGQASAEIISLAQLKPALDLFSILLAMTGLLAIIWAWLQFSNYRYELTGEAFKKEMGVIAKKYVSIPYEQVQNVDVNRSLLHRVLGLSEVQIQTAGMSGDEIVPAAEGVLPGVSSGIGEELRNDLSHRASTSQ